MADRFSIHLFALFLILLCSIAVQASADGKSPPPAGMTQQQYDALVKSVGESVIQTLSEKGLVAKPAPAADASAPENADIEELAAQRVRESLSQVPVVLHNYPEIWTDLAGLGNRLDGTAAGGRGFWTYFCLLIATVAAALAAEAAVRRLTFARRQALGQEFAATGGLQRVAAAAILDLLALMAFWLVAHLGLYALFADAGAQTQFATVVLKGLVIWRAFFLLFQIYVRPGLPALRIAPVAEESANRLFRLYSLAILIFVLTRIWMGALSSPAAISAAILTNSFIILVFAVFVVLSTRADISEWFLGMNVADARKKGFKAILARHWHWIALPVLVALSLARANDALSNRLQIPFGAILTLIILFCLLFAETLASFVIRTHRAAVHTASGRPHPGRLVPFLVRAVRATLWLIAVAVLVRTWAVDVLALVDEQEWQDFRRGWITSVLTVLVAYLAWEAIRSATVPIGGPRGPGTIDEEDDVPAGQAPLTASRIETLAPILRVAGGFLIVITAALTIMGSLGISITPLIAGASVFGLAISFGSQTLVRDIVSGFFYLADDAFRVGEYIDCGKAKGSVEGFTLRSIRLRHQNGQIHTIPFGQLGQISNFSRDWSTLKFNLRFARQTDIDKLRKVTKKVGQAMAADPEMKDDFLEPLKLQGVADIADNAMVMRFKTTVRPVRPSFIQREAVKRLIAAVKEANIEFASATVAVQSIGGGSMDLAAAAAAAAAASAPPPKVE